MTTSGANAINTETTMSPTADQLRTLKIFAANQVRRHLVETEAYYRNGIDLGYLSDSSMDNVSWFAAENYTVRASGFCGNIDSVIVRVSDANGFQDFIVSYTLNSRCVPSSSVGIREDMRGSF